jgi:inorganic pyrophosphatase
MENSKIINSIIVTPYNSNIEYEYEDKKIFFKRELTDNLKPQFNYSIIPKSYNSNFKYLENIIIFKKSIQSGTYIKTKIIGGFKFIDNNNKYHEVMISVPYNSIVNNINEISHFNIEQIKTYTIYYYQDINKRIRFIGFIDNTEAFSLYKTSIIRYKSKNKEKTEKQKKNIFISFLKFIKKNKKNKTNNNSDNISASSIDGILSCCGDSKNSFDEILNTKGYFE